MRRLQRAPIIAAAGIAAVVVIVVVFFVLPKMRAVSEARADLEAAQDDESALRAQYRSLQEAEAAAPQTEAEIDLIEEQIPPTVDLPTLFRQLQAAADRSAVDFFSFSPGSPAVDPTGRFSTIASQLTVNGGYFSVDEFLFLLETLPRAAKVTAIQISPAGADTGTTTTTAPTTSDETLTVVATVEFYTSDISAGPGSEPGPSEAAVGATGAVVTGATGA